MKKSLTLLIFAMGTLLLFPISGCKKDKCENQYCLNGGSCSSGSGDCQCPTGYSGEHCQNYSGGGGGGGGTCTYTSYYGPQSCTQSGYVAVSTTSCCPASAPYTCDGASYCYATCQEAKDAGCGAVVYGTGQTGGGGTSGYNCNGTSCYSVSSGANYATLTQCQNNCSGGGTCNYTQWTGTGNCANTGYYPVYSNTCCPSSSPYYNTGSNACYTSCTNAKNANASGSIYLANTSGSGGACDWQNAVSNLVITTQWGNRCNSSTSLEVFIKNNSSKKIKSYICVQKSDGTYSSWGDVDGLTSGETYSGYACTASGSYKVYAEYFDTYVANGYCSYPGCN